MLYTMVVVYIAYRHDKSGSDLACVSQKTIKAYFSFS